MGIMNYAVSVAAAGALVSYGVLKLQRLMIYPSNFPEDSRSVVDSPESFDLPYENVWLENEGERIHGYLLLATPPAPKTVVMLGPNAGNIGHSLPLAQLFFRELGTNVLTVSYRGYGRSTGSPSEKAIKSDAQVLLEYLQSHPVLSRTNIVLYGRSLGGAVAIYLASIGKSFFKAVIVENTFLSIPHMVRVVLPMASLIKHLVTEKWESYKAIKNVDPSTPFLFLGGEKDELVPPKDFRELFSLCPAKRKFFKTYPRGTHNDTCVQPLYWQDVHHFLNSYVEPIVA